MTGRARVEATQRAAGMREDAWQSRVMDLAAIRGWKRVHVRAARTERGWRTAYEGDSGLPDMILARAGRVLLVELKSTTGRPTVEQAAWLAAAGSNGYLWRPADWVDVQAVLR